MLRVLPTWLQLRKGQSLRREGNKVEALEGKSLPKKKARFYLSRV